jgi:hypothetical protein
MFLALLSLSILIQPIPANALPGPDKQVRYQEEKSAINRDLAAISQHRENIKSLKSQYAQYRKEDNQAAQASTCRTSLGKSNAEEGEGQPEKR